MHLTYIQDKMKLALVLIFMSGGAIYAQTKDSLMIGQDTVFAFFEYKIKDAVGMEDAFYAGYERDLQWHKSQNDKWAWIGWSVDNGDRRGRFIDATPNHSWSDFDNWNVSAVLNGKLNKIHWLNYVENPSGSYKITIPSASNITRDWFKAASLQVHTIKIKIAEEKTFFQFQQEFKTFLGSYLGGLPFIWMKTVSGGSINEYQFFVCLNKKEQMGNAAGIFSVTKMPAEVWKKYALSVISNETEMWSYMPAVSLYPGSQ